jgi:hypothetical protein
MKRLELDDLLFDVDNADDLCRIVALAVDMPSDQYNQRLNKASAIARDIYKWENIIELIASEDTSN